MHMKPIRIARGEIVGIKGTSRRCIITQIIDLNTVGIRDCGTRQEPQPIAVSELVSAPEASATGRDEAAAHATETPIPELTRIDSAAWQIARQRQAAIRPVYAMHRPSTELVKAHAEAAGCHYVTFYRWLRRYRNSGGLLTSLLDGLPSVPKGTRRLHPDIEKLLEETITSHYLTPQRDRATKVDEAMQAACHAHGIPKEDVDGSGYCKPHINTIRARIAALHPKVCAEKRDGKDKATKFNVTGNGFEAKYPLDYVQIDHTQVNVVLRDDETGYVMGRPWITLAIDVYSRMILGFYVSFERPNALATGLCISMMILGKDDWLRENASVFKQVPSWPCYGRPNTLHLDNAGEFRGDMVERACEQYGINVTFRPTGAPQFGAHIESLMDKFSKECETLPGATFSNPIKRGKHYDSEAQSALNMPEFMAWLTNHLLCIYHYRPHSGLDGKNPLQRWTQGFLEGSELAPPLGSLPDRYTGEDAQRLILDFIPYELRGISEEGVVIDKIRYMDDVLRRWIGTKDPERINKPRQFTFRRDPRDLSVIYFWEPELSRYERIPYRNLARPPITLWELRAARKDLREQRKLPDGLHNEAMIFDAVLAKRDVIERAAARTLKLRQAGRLKPGIHKDDTPPPAKSVTGPAPRRRQEKRGTSPGISMEDLSID